MVQAVVGANWGDEGKGKITDTLAEKADIVVRFQGGANAGHTIVNKYGKFALHTLPSGVFHQNITNVIGNGVALNIPLVLKEVNELVSAGVPAPKLLISDRAQIVMSYHILFDAYEEERLAGKSYGSTKSGIAPFYSDKYAKIGFQVSELWDEEILSEKAEKICTLIDRSELLGLNPGIVREQITDQLRRVEKEVFPIADLVADGIMRIIRGNHGNHIRVILSLFFSEDHRSAALPATAELKQVMEVQIFRAVFVSVIPDPAVSHQTEDTFPLRQFVKAKFNFITFFSSHDSPFYSRKQLCYVVFLYK